MFLEINLNLVYMQRVTMYANTLKAVNFTDKIRLYRITTTMLVKVMKSNFEEFNCRLMHSYLNSILCSP